MQYLYFTTFFYTYYSQTDLKVCKGQEQSKAGNFWFLFSLVLLLLLLSCQLFKVKTSLFERKHCYLSESIIIFHSNDHPISSQRKKEPQIRRLNKLRSLYNQLHKSISAIWGFLKREN